MPFTLLPTREEVFRKSDEECEKLAKSLKKLGSVFVDEEFPPDGTSLGDFPDRRDEPINWVAPQDLVIAPPTRQDTDSWTVWRDPWPFQVCQYEVGDCWLIAALQTIARRKSLLDQIVPKRWFTMKHGIAQIRLSINGEWKVIKIDFHVPSTSESIEVFAPLVRKQAWVALIQKAFAKLRGSYAKLRGGTGEFAFHQLTGSFTSIHYLKKLSSDNDIWDFILRMHPSDMSCMSFDFISHPIESQLDDIHQFLIKEGKMIKSDTGELAVYKLDGRDSNVFLYENNCRSNFISVKGSMSNCLHEKYVKDTNGFMNLSFEIPPQSRVILGVVACKWKYFTANFDVEFKVLPFVWTVRHWFAPLVKYFVPESLFNYSFQTPVKIKKRQDHRWTVEEKAKKY